ncbi:hypothetical protein M231_07468 [Tremella mesenterica]|uniref:GATA-type domain-containing protein n=1 Tax=Tremella mesenterica TaxID=5217 RepID=A0A4V1M313_TREME|nr:hypothetical protein M231_07468 [Tremella mesenterica]
MSIASDDSTSSTGVPRLGGVRCYWALVTPRQTHDRLELVFVHPDPVLGAHLARQQYSLMGRGVIEFIHPAEREQARRDLANAIAVDDLQGSVTRMRFARLSRIRTILGCPPEEVDVPYDAEVFVEDDEYLILDLVLNWVADGLLLAFFHAIKDKDKVANNDPLRKNEEWSNFCGTAFMSDEQVQALHHDVSTTIAVSPTSGRIPPRRVFQLHRVLGPSQPPQLVFSWPPVQAGSYSPQEFAELMDGVDMDPSQLATVDNEMRTNCTTRFGAKHSVTTEGQVRHVQSVFVPYGSLIFACFQTTLVSPSPGQSFIVPTHQPWMTPSSVNWSEPRAQYEDVFHTPPHTHHSHSHYPHSTYSIPFTPHPDHLGESSDTYHSLAHPYTPPMGKPYDRISSRSVSRGLSMEKPRQPMSHSGGGSQASRPMIRPPAGVERCAFCGTLESPEWRRNESGIKDLCNA